MAETAFARLRRAEFVAGLPTGMPQLAPAEGASANRLLAALLLTAGTLLAAGWRCRDLSWQHGNTPAELALGALWGAAGLLPMWTAAFGGWAWRQAGGATGRGRPLLHLLPLREGDVLWAKLQGRLAALLLALLGSVGLLVLARALMALTGLVQPLPPLLDPWLPGSGVLFAALFVASWRIDWALRRGGPTCLTALVAPLLLVAVGVWGRRLLGHGPWDVVLLATQLLVAVLASSVIAWYEERLGARARQAALPRPVAAPPASRREPAATGLPLPPPLTGEELRRGVTLAAKLIPLLALLGLVAEAVAAVSVAFAAWRSTGHWGLAAANVAEVAVPSFPLWGPAALSLLLPLTLWSEMGQGSASQARAGRSRSLVVSHLGYLLPVPARTVWRRRFVWLTGVQVLLTVVGLGSYLLLQQVNRLLGLADDCGLPFGTPAAVAAALALSWSLFALPPLLRRAMPAVEQVRWHHVVLVVGALAAFALPLIIALGASDATLGFWSRLSRAGLPPLLLTAPVLAVLLLRVSWLGVSPAAWPLRPDGAFAARSKWQAVALTLLLPSAIMLGGLTVFELSRYLQGHLVR